MLQELLENVGTRRRRWLVTGGAGFIGSHLVEALLRANQDVVVLDDLSTGHLTNMEAVQDLCEGTRGTLRFVVGDIADEKTCRDACRGVEIVLNQAAIASVPRSVAEPQRCLEVNVAGFINILEAMRAHKVRRLVFASSSAVYGPTRHIPAREDLMPDPISPYAASKLENELYARVYSHLHGLEFVGLRYFNIYGPRQDPSGPYAAVISKWMDAFVENGQPLVFGDGESTRDFCFVKDVVQANLAAAVSTESKALNRVYNIGTGRRVTLNELYAVLRDAAAELNPEAATIEPEYREPREGDIRHSGADISAARHALGFEPAFGLKEGLRAYVRSLTPSREAGR